MSIERPKCLEDQSAHDGGHAVELQAYALDLERRLTERDAENKRLRAAFADIRANTEHHHDECPAHSLPDATCFCGRNLFRSIADAALTKPAEPPTKPCPRCHNFMKMTAELRRYCECRGTGRVPAEAPTKPCPVCGGPGGPPWHPAQGRCDKCVRAGRWADGTYGCSA